MIKLTDTDELGPPLSIYKAKALGNTLGRGMFLFLLQMLVLAGIGWVAWWALGQVGDWAHQVIPPIPTRSPWINRQGLGFLVASLVGLASAFVWHIVGMFWSSPAAWGRWSSLPDLNEMEFLEGSAELGFFEEIPHFETVIAMPKPIPWPCFCSRNKEPLVYALDMASVILVPFNQEQASSIATEAPFPETFFYGVLRV